MKRSKTVWTCAAIIALVMGGALPATASEQQGTRSIAHPLTSAQRSANGVALPMGVTVCEPGAVTYSTSSITKSGRVTNWHKHVKNDSTSETLSLSTSNTVSVKATASVSGSLSASVAIKKIAEVALGVSGSFGVEGAYASTSTFTRSATFTSAGKWVLYAGVYTGSGTVKKHVCNSTGTVITTSTGTAFTYKNARTTGLVNCSKSVSDLVAANAKSKCG